MSNITASATTFNSAVQVNWAHIVRGQVITIPVIHDRVVIEVQSGKSETFIVRLRLVSIPEAKRIVVCNNLAEVQDAADFLVTPGNCTALMVEGLSLLRNDAEFLTQGFAYCL